MEQIESNQTLRKGGDILIRTRIRRDREGMSLNVWAVPDIEDFMRGLSGRQVDVAAYERYWEPLKGRGPLMVYEIPKDLKMSPNEDGAIVSLSSLGLPLLSIDDTSREDRNGRVIRSEVKTLNLSFLRFVGISEGDGITFKIKGVYSPNMINYLDSALGEAERRFYREFLKPMDFAIMVMSQPL